MEDQIEKPIYKRTRNLLFFGFVIIYASILVYLCKEINVWEDEVYSLNTTSKSLSVVINQSYTFEGQPPVYFLLLALWRTISSGIFFARLFSVIFIALSAYMIHRIVRLFSDTENAHWMVIIFLLNPFSVWAALEIRTYSLLIFLSTVSLFFFLQYYLFNKTKHLFYFLLICLIGLYTQYFFSFVMIALTVPLLVFKGWKCFLKQCLYFIPLVVLFIPNLFFITKNLEIAQSATNDYGLVQRISVVLHTPQNFILALQKETFHSAINWGIKIIFVFSILMALIIIYRKYRKDNVIILKYVSGLFIIGFVLVLLYSFFNAYTGIWYDDKYMAVAFPFFILFFALFGFYPIHYKRLVFGAFSIYFMVLLAFNYFPPVKNYDYKYLAKYISKIEHQNEPVLCYSDLISLSLDYYYNGENTISPLPEAPSFDENYIKNIADTAGLKNSIEKKYGISKSYLFISDDMRKYSQNLNMNREMIDDYLKNKFHITFDTLYFGRSKNLYIRVRRLENILRN